MGRWEVPWLGKSEVINAFSGSDNVMPARRACIGGLSSLEQAHGGGLTLGCCFATGKYA